MQEIQVLDVGYSTLFPDIDTIGTERIGDWVVMVTTFGHGCVSSWGVFPACGIALAEVRKVIAEDSEYGMSYAYEIWHLVDDSTECTTEDACDCESNMWSETVAWIRAMRTDDARSDFLVASFVPIHDKSLPLYNCECNKWSEMLAWIGAMLPVIDMASYELKTSAV